MAMGTRRKRERQQDLWIATSDVVEIPANVFYDRLNQVLDEHKFDAKVERLCQKFYKKSALRTAEHGSGDLLSISSDRVLRGTGFGARDRLADSRLSVVTEVSGFRTGREHAGPLHNLPVRRSKIAATHPTGCDRSQPPAAATPLRHAAEHHPGTPSAALFSGQLLRCLEQLLNSLPVV
jgi:hypothetical protein